MSNQATLLPARANRWSCLPPVNTAVSPSEGMHTLRPTAPISFFQFAGGFVDIEACYLAMLNPTTGAYQPRHAVSRRAQTLRKRRSPLNGHLHINKPLLDRRLRTESLGAQVGIDDTENAPLVAHTADLRLTLSKWQTM
ncbi:hypothetical protein PSPO01_16543 [Paraphaeosphaeria sporulosa]